jgi:glycosyltransferase involved in cell wall biosynthesis
MRIAITGQTYYPGNNGQAIFTIHLAEGLSQAGHEVHVITPSWKFGYDHQILHGVHIHKVRSINFRWVHPEACFTFYPSGQIQAVFEETRPDVVHLQDHYFLSRDVIRMSERMHIPVVGTNHFLPENLLPYLHLVPMPDRLKISILWDLMLWTYNRLVLVTTPTETAAKILMRQKIKPPVEAVSCGVDTNHFCPMPGFNRVGFCEKFGLDPNKILFLYVGRLDGEKRIDLLLRGLAKLIKGGRTDISLAIAGQGAAKAELRSLARELGITNQVRFLGYVENEDLSPLYRTGHIFCMPSPEELQSIATLEAMATGLPILAANARALPELVTQGINGFLFEPGKVAAVAEGMAYLADHCHAWEQMGQASRARALGHSIEKTIHRYEAIYARVLGSPLDTAAGV